MAFKIIIVLLLIKSNRNEIFPIHLITFFLFSEINIERIEFLRINDILKIMIAALKVNPQEQVPKLS